MNGSAPVALAIPALLSTQLLAAEVYATFLRLSSETEAFLWKSMLEDELDHVRHLRRIMDMPGDNGVLPLVNVAKMRETCQSVLAMGQELFLLRLEGALRLECAELDFGLEGLIARRLERNELLPGYPGDVASHLTKLLHEASRYSQSPNIGRQMTRLSELFETSLKAVPRISIP